MLVKISNFRTPIKIVSDAVKLTGSTKKNINCTKHILLIVLTILLTKGYSQNDSISPQNLELLKTEQTRMFNLFGNGDVETFKKITGEDYLSINADGTYINKSQAYELIPKFKGSTYKIIEQTDRVYNNVVISTGRAKFYLGSFLVADIYFNQTWVYSNGTWKFINWQGTMTGTPKYYPIYLTLFFTIIVLSLLFWIIKRVKRRKSNI